MKRRGHIQWAAGIFVAASLAALGCSSAESQRSEGALGQARVLIQQAPADVHCVRITAAGSLITTRLFDISPAESSVFALSGLPLGLVAFSGEAFPAACSEVTDDAAPSWVADPVSATLVAGVVADVALTMHRNGLASVVVDFSAAGTCANGVQDGTESGIDCGGSCLPCTTEAGQGGQSGSGGTPGSAGAASGGEPARALLFSEYVEGSSTYKALEITALEGGSIEGCHVAVYFNGGTTANGIALTGALSAGESHVLCSSSLAALIGSCDQTAGLTFNGDDAIVLECDGLVVDAIGQVGFDPGTAWGTAEASLLDHTLRRKCEVTAGDTNATDSFDPASEWTGHALDSFQDLGMHACP